MRIHVAPTRDLAEAAGRRLGDVLTRHADTPTLLLLSGGSALSLLTFVGDEALRENLAVSLLDERAIPTASNAAAIAATGFLDRLRDARAVFLDSAVTPTDVPATIAARLGTAVAGWRAKYPRSITVATFGVGPDGHTAGIMPFPKEEQRFTELFENEHVLFQSYDATGKNPIGKRVTATLPFIRSVAAGVGLVSGEEKRAALERVAFRRPLHETPAAVLATLPELDLFTDIAGLPVVE